jgi:hypothetical protein
MAAVESVGGRRGSWRIDVAEDGGSVVLTVVYVDLRGIDQPVVDAQDVEIDPQDALTLAEVLRKAALAAGMQTW